MLSLIQMRLLLLTVLTLLLVPIIDLKSLSLVEQLESTERQINAVRDIMNESNFEEMPLYGNESDKARAFMKIQEGCNNYCAFCIIPILEEN